MFSIVTVASSTRMPTASARPPNVMMLSVCPAAASPATAASTASGMEAAMMTVDRHEPRNSRIIRLVSAAAITPSRTTPETAAFTNNDWSASGCTLRSGGSVSASLGRIAFTPSTIAMVEAAPLFSTVISTARRPSTRTTLRCGGDPSRTCATSRISTVVPSTVRIGRPLSASTASGELLRRTLYS